MKLFESHFLVSILLPLFTLGIIIKLFHLVYNKKKTLLNTYNKYVFTCAHQLHQSIYSVTTCATKGRHTPHSQVKKWSICILHINFNGKAYDKNILL